MKKVPVSVTTNNCAPNRSPAVIVDHNVNELQIIIQYSDGSTKEIFKGNQFSEVKWKEKKPSN